jgi:glucosamine--fructose-6-phosphate aminotransferase (isomerizing)
MTETYMAAEIAEQPDMLRTRAPDWAARAAELRRGFRGDVLAVLGRGSSGNACTFAAYVYGVESGRQAVEFRPWLATQKSPVADWSDATALAFSTSGESTDIALATGWLRERGAHVVGVSNDPDPTAMLSRHSDEILRLRIGEERAVPATKSFCAQLFAAAALCGVNIVGAAAKAADCMATILESPLSSELGAFLDGARMTWWIGRGPALAAALDAALKLQETAGLPSTATSAAEFLHGPMGALGTDDRVVIMADTSEPLQSLRTVLAALINRGTPFSVLGEREMQDVSLPVPLPAERWARTPVFAMISQLVALRVAERRGRNPDAPGGLRKVTRTI